MLDGRVDADVAERQAWLTQQIPDQSRELVARQRRQFDCEARHLAGRADERVPVAARGCEDARGDTDRMVVGEGTGCSVSGGGHRPTVARSADAIRRHCLVLLRVGHPDAVLKRIDQVEQLVALPDAAPLALVEPLQDSRTLKHLQSLANGHWNLPVSVWATATSTTGCPGNALMSCRTAASLRGWPRSSSQVDWSSSIASASRSASVAARAVASANCAIHALTPPSRYQVSPPTYPIGSAARMRLIGGT